jgi:peptidoglycan/LPS O-acetylase OafA/YrhL
MQAKSNYIPALDGLRAFAIFTLLLGHAVDSRAHSRLCGIGRIGVHLFLAISGYLLTTSLLREYANSGRISLRNFYIRFVFRGLPPALFYLGIIWLLARTGLVLCSWTAIRAALFFYTDYAPFTEFGWRVGHLFSLAVEAHFYMLWPALLLLFGIRKGGRTAAIGAVTIILWRILDDRFRILAHLFHAPWLTENLYRTDLVADVIFWGCFLAFYLRSTERISLSPLYSTAIAGTAAVFLVSSIFWQMPHTAFLILLFPAVLIGAIVIAPNTPLARLLELPILRFFGKLSFSLYIWQQLFLGGPGPRLPVPFALIAVLACSYFSYKVIEQPCIRLGRRLCRPTAVSQTDSQSQQPGLAMDNP